MRTEKSNSSATVFYFGVCPECAGCDGYLNEAQWHWMVCHTHRVKWCIGEDIAPGWKEEGGEQQQLSFALLPEYAEVEPEWLEQESSSSYPVKPIA